VVSILRSAITRQRYRCARPFSHSWHDQIMRKTLVAFATASLILVASLAACSVASSAVHPQTDKAGFVLNGATICVPTPASPTTTRPKAWFDRAKQEWQRGADSDSANQGLCWGKAALDLDSVASLVKAGTSGYVAAAGELERLSALPDAMDTTAQMTEAQSLTRRLNDFFGTKGEYGVGATGPTTTTTSPNQQLTISVQSDSQMRAEGNNGPSSSILMPTSCERNGTTVTAQGTYQDGFAPYVYGRYGDTVELYVFTAPVADYPPPGIVLGLSSVANSPAIGGSGNWEVTATVDTSLGVPASCVVAAQPTHDEVLAP